MLSGLEEEHGTDHHAVCTVQLMDGTQQIDADTGVSASENGVIALNAREDPAEVSENARISGSWA